MSFDNLVWIVWLLIGSAWEVKALKDKKKGDTLTESIRPIIGSHPIIWFVGAGLFVWTGLHFFGPTWQWP